MENEGQRDNAMEVWIITGLSGAGKTNAIHIFEDWDYLCIDNLPPALLGATVAMIKAAGSVRYLALGVDVRSGRFFDELMPALAKLTAEGNRPSILFLDADTPTLVNRFKETRRRHPMSAEGVLVDTIQAERDRLVPMREIADVVIDTSNLKVKDLKEELDYRIYYGKQEDQLKVHVVTFGYKYGIPMDADLLMDVRFLPNPHYIPALQPLTGRDAAVRTYVMEHEVSQVFYEKFYELLVYLIPRYIEEGKTNLVVAIGCTGGRHRSVALGELLYASLTEAGYSAAIRHRDAERVDGETSITANIPEDSGE
jgi:UPF0042 nucleotide-binding protein